MTIHQDNILVYHNRAVTLEKLQRYVAAYSNYCVVVENTQDAKLKADALNGRCTCLLHMTDADYDLVRNHPLAGLEVSQ